MLTGIALDTRVGEIAGKLLGTGSLGRCSDTSDPQTLLQTPPQKLGEKLGFRATAVRARVFLIGISATKTQDHTNPAKPL